MKKQNYREQQIHWPQHGKHILAQFDDHSILVYQAYKHSIGRFAASNQHFGGDFSYSRMSWIKPNFLWMMYRSGWGTKPGQEITLAVRLKRSFFDRVLELAVASAFGSAKHFRRQEDWRAALTASNVRLQWDPDHDPTGTKLQRKAIQLGLRNDVLKEYGTEAIIEITDISQYVSEQRNNVDAESKQLVTPEERVYIPDSSLARGNVGLDPAPTHRLDTC